MVIRRDKLSSSVRIRTPHSRFLRNGIKDRVASANHGQGKRACVPLRKAASVL